MNRLLLEYISKILSESSPASEQAKQMGLDYMGFGQWGKGGRVTHKNADKDGTMLVVYKPKTEDVGAEPEKDTKKRKSSYSSYPEIQAEDLNAASLADKIREGIVAPGNDFSKYQEAVSVFIAKYIVDNPEATDQEIMERIVLLDCGSKLLTKDVKATLPKKYTNDYNDLKQAGVFSTCSKDYKDDQHKARFATMLFAKRKAELMLSGIERVKLDSPRIDSFSGDQDSLNSLLTLVKSSTGKIYSPDGTELKKDEVIESIGGFGTSKFPADTSLIAIDRFGNMVFVGYSDKKDLNAIINNSTVASEISSHTRVLDSLLDREVLSQELYDDLAGSLHTLEGEYNNIENELKTATLGPAGDLVEISKNNPEQLTELVALAKRLSGGKTPDKYFTKLTGAIRVAYKNRNSKIFKLWEPLLTQAGWNGENEPTEEQMLVAFAIKSFEVLDTESSGGWNSYPVSRGEDTLTKDAQELLFRLMVPDGSPQKKEFVERVGIIRDRSLQILTEAREQLDKVTVGLEDGSSVKLGTYLDAIQAWRALHLDMSKYDGSLVMAAEDIIVDASDLIRCMKGVETDEEFAKTLDISTKRTTDKSYGTVTGQNVEIFAISPAGKRIKIGTRSIRSKDGILGKLQTTYNYHKDFQQCLREKSGKSELNERIKPSKLLLEYIKKILTEIDGLDDLGENREKAPRTVTPTRSGRWSGKHKLGEPARTFAKKEDADHYASTGKSPARAKSGRPSRSTKSTSRIRSSEWVASKVFGGLFTESSLTTISRGGVDTTVRQIIDPKTKKPIDTGTDEGRTRAIELINSQIESIQGKIEKAVGLRKNGVRRSVLDKWMGNVGEMIALRDLLTTGFEAYLLPDSEDENDLTVITKNGSEEALVHVSVKSSTGKVFGSMGSNIRTPLSNALRGSQITIDGKKYDASDVVNSELDVYTEIMRFLTEEALDRNTGDILVRNDDPNYDGDIIGDAKESGKKPQTAIRRARKMTVDDINKFIEKLNDELETKEGLFYKRVLADKSEAVIELMFKRLEKLKQEIEELTKKRQAPGRAPGEPTDVRLVDLETFFVNALGGVIDLSQKTIASATHLIEVSLLEAGGSNIRIIPGGCVEQRTSEAIKDMNGVQQLSYMNLSLRTRAPEGFLRPIINAPPLTRDVRTGDRLTPDEFKNYSESGETGCPEKISDNLLEQTNSCGN